MALLLVVGLALGSIFFAFRRLYRGATVLMVAGTLNGLILPIDLGPLHVDVRPDQLIIVPLLLVLLTAYLTRQAMIYRTELDIPILGLLFTNVLSSVLFSPLKGVSYQGVTLMSVYVLMYFAMANVLMQQPPLRIIQIVRLFVALGVAHAIYGHISITMYSLGLNAGGIQHGQIESSVSIRGTFHEANLLGIYLAIIGVFLLSHLVLGRTVGRRRLRLLSGLVLICSALAMTLTRSAWLAFTVSVLVVFAQGFREQRSLLQLRRPVLVTGVALVTTLLIVLLLVGPLVSSFSGQANVLLHRVQRMVNLSDSTIIGRWQAYTIGFERWRQRPMLGYGTFAGEEINLRWFNSSIVQAMHDSGLIGLLFLLWLHGRVTFVAWRESRLTPLPFYRSSLFACTMGNAIIFVTSQTSSFLWVGFPWIFMGLTIALVHASRYERAVRITGTS